MYQITKSEEKKETKTEAPKAETQRDSHYNIPI